MGQSWRAMWRAEYTLNLGLPLVAGLTTAQLAGVIAHELGHFNQSLGCRLAFLVYRIQLWFARVVFEPDRIDEWLKRRAHGRLEDFVDLARLPTYVVRKTLKLLMRGTHLASYALSRQQEFDADQSMSWIAGSTEFPGVVRRIASLDAASGMFEQLLNRCLTDEIIFDDYPQLVAALADRLDDETSQRVADALADRKRSLGSSHPPLADRIDRVALDSQPSVLRLAEPAAVLFRDFGATCRKATAATASMYGRKATPWPTARFVSWIDHWHELDAVRERFYRCASHMFQAKAVPTTRLAAQTSADRVAQLREIRRRLLASEHKFRHWADQRDLVEFDVVHLHLASAVLQYTPTPEVAATVAKRVFRSPQEVAAALKAAQQKWDEADAMMSQIGQLDGQRLRMSLDLLADPAVRRQLPHVDELARRAKSYFSLAVHLDRQMPALRGLWRRMQLLKQDCTYLQSRIDVRDSTGESPAELTKFYGRFAAWTAQEAEELRVQLKSIRSMLGEAPYPFEHGRPGMTIGKFAVEELPADHSPAAVLDAAWGALMTANFTHDRLFLELAWIAEQVEDAVGLEHMPRLPKNDPPKTPRAPLPWHQLRVSWLTLPRLCLILGLLLVLAGLPAIFVNLGIALFLLIPGTLLTIGSILAMA